MRNNSALYANSRAPIFLDNVRITLGAPGEQPLTSQARLAVADYENGIGTIVFLPVPLSKPSAMPILSASTSLPF